MKIFLYSDATLQCVRQFYVELTGLRKDRQCVNGLPTFPRCPLQNIHGGGGKEQHNKPFVNISCSKKKNVKLGDRFLSLTIDMFVRKLCRSLLNNTTQRIAAIARRISMGTVIEQRTLKQWVGCGCQLVNIVAENYYIKVDAHRSLSQRFCRRALQKVWT